MAGLRQAVPAIGELRGAGDEAGVEAGAARGVAGPEPEPAPRHSGGLAVTLRFRELEHTRLFAGLGVRLVDDYTEQGPIGWTRVFLDVADGDGWRELPADLMPRTRTGSGLVWFPWLERYRDARGRGPGKYRVRVAAECSVP